MPSQLDFPWEREAMKNAPIPDGLGISEQCAYQAVAYLYARYKSNVISREAASREKKLIKRALEDRQKSEAFAAKLMAHNVEVINRTESARAAYRKAPAMEAAIEAVGRIVEAIDNVPVKEPQWNEQKKRNIYEEVST